MAKILTRVGAIGGIIRLWRTKAGYCEGPGENGGRSREERRGIRAGMVFLAGNPMVDTSIATTNDYIRHLGLEEGLEPHDLSTSRRVEIFEEVSQNSLAEISPGGSALNTAMALQWTLGKDSDKVSCCTGAIGDDDAGRLLTQACEKARVNAIFQIVPNVLTGRSAVLVPKSGDRCIVTVRGAYRHLRPSFVKSPSSPAYHAIRNAEILYATSFLTSTEARYRVADHLANVAKDRGKVFALNLSSKGLFEVPEYKRRILSLLPKAGLVFGNASEAQAISRSLYPNAETHDVESAVYRIAGVLPKRGSVIITNGRDPTIIAQRVEEKTIVSKKFPVTFSKNHNKALRDLGPVVDTNGAGDAFVGGFLAALLPYPQRPDIHSLKSVVDAGHYAAGIAVRCRGNIWVRQRVINMERPRICRDIN